MTTDEMVAKLAEALQELVTTIENKPTTTMGHYGDYMAAIPNVVAGLKTKHTRNAQLAVGLAMIRAGANRQGVTEALKALGKL